MHIQSIKQFLRGDTDKSRIFILISEIIHILFALIYVIIYFPLQAFINIIYLLFNVIINGSDFMNHINHNFEYAFGVRFYNLNY